VIPAPEPGLVISYAYLWHYEQQAGREEGRKDRPAVIVLTLERQQDGAMLVTVLPITHSPPVKPDAGIAIPDAVKRHLGLDDKPSWVIVNEGNEFVWPGYDLRKLPRTGSYEYGFLRPRLFNSVRDAFELWYAKGGYQTIPRD